MGGEMGGKRYGEGASESQAHSIYLYMWVHVYMYIVTLPKNLLKLPLYVGTSLYSRYPNTIHRLCTLVGKILVGKTEKCSFIKKKLILFS